VKELAALTPTELCGIKTKIHLIKDSVTAELQNDARLTYVNVLRNSNQKVTSHPLHVISSKKIISAAMKVLKDSGQNIQFVYDSAMESGWTYADISYDSMVNGIILNDIASATYNGKYCPEIDWATTHVVIVICSYYNEQYIGWFFYNENIDTILNYSNFGL
jgi:hypothetical protein